MSPDSDQFDFFVSYARSDNADGRITRFLDELLVEHRKFTGNDPARELKPFFDQQDIHSLDDWRHRAYEGLAASRLLLAFISPNYFASEWSRREWETWKDLEISKRILSAGAAPIYLVEVPGFVGKVPGLTEQATLSDQQVAANIAKICGLPKPHDSFVASVSLVVRQMRRHQITSDFVKPFRDEGVDALRRTDVRLVFERLAKDLDQRVQDVKRAAQSQTTIPPYNKRFSGRLDELLALRDRLNDNRAGVISGVVGLGGIGKTELAFTYAHAFASAYPGGRFLVPCEGKTSLRDAALALGAPFRDIIRDEERKTAETYFAAITACLRERLDRLGHILLVLDNVTDPAVFTPQQTDCLTALGPKLHLLVTTRLAPPAGERGNWLTLGELPEGDALDLLEKHRPFASDAERDAARRIVKRLGGFALAVELVAAWLKRHPSVTCAGFLERLGLEELELLDRLVEEKDVELRRHNHERLLSAVIGPAFSTFNEAERTALHFAALMPPDRVVLPWLRALVAEMHPQMEIAIVPGHPDPLQQIEQRLFSLSFFTRSQDVELDPRTARCHRLLQEYLVADIRERPKLEAALTRFIERRILSLEESASLQEHEWELLAIDSLAWKWDGDLHEKSEWLLGELVRIWADLGDSQHAVPIFQRLITLGEIQAGSSSAKVKNLIQDLAHVMREVGRSHDAEALLRKALVISERLYGSASWRFAKDIEQLAELLFETGRLREAEPLLRRVISISEATLGENHPKVARNIKMLAELLRDTEHFRSAEPLLRRAIKIEKVNHASQQFKVARLQHDLAQLLQDTGKPEEAEALLRQALETDIHNFGESHFYTCRRLAALASLLESMNKFEDAEALLVRSIVALEQEAGASHPDIIRQKQCLQRLQDRIRKPIVFLSHRHQDYDHVRPLFEFLKAHRIEPFVSSVSIRERGESKWMELIESQIKLADHMVVVAPGRDAFSTWVKREINAFMRELDGGRKTGNLVTWHGPTVRSEDLPPFLSDFQMVVNTMPLDELLPYLSKMGDKR